MFLLIEKTGETKNMIDFCERFTGLKFCLMKSNFQKAFKEFAVWRENTYASNFSSELYRLICHADHNNLVKFLKGFPEETIIYLLWLNSASENVFFHNWDYLCEEEENEI